MRHGVSLMRGVAPESVPRDRLGFLPIKRLSIAHRIFLVGAIPIVAAMMIGIVSLVLLNQADDARRGALMVSTVFRHVVTAMAQRDAYVAAPAAERQRHSSAFVAALNGATDGLGAINDETDDPEEASAVLATIASLERYRVSMSELQLAVARNDRLLKAMDERLAALIGLTDQARDRQHESNADIVQSLRARDGSLRQAQDLVAASQRARAAITDHALDRNDPAIAAGDPFRDARLANATDALTDLLDHAGLSRDAEQFRAVIAGLVSGHSPEAALAWIDRRIKIDGTASRSLQSEVAELLTYTVEAHETEQATQNIAVETLKLADRTSQAVERRNLPAISSVVEASRALGDRIASLPIAPLIQTEMLDALDSWREGLTEARDGLANQDATLKKMSETAGSMVFEVSNLNTTLSENADSIGRAARRMLVLGAGLGLLAGAFFGLGVARSITRPLKRLEHDMLHRAVHPDAGPLLDGTRRDEIGHMARATNQFLRELGKRESALRSAKEGTERALAELKRTQSELIQSEKLASLGQLVAGVAHEINTPLGVALTTTSVMREETTRFQEQATSGKVTRAAFDDFVERVCDGSRLIAANLERAAHLVVSFKQVAADQASGERRAFAMNAFLDELFTSLGPMGKRAGHRIEIRCEPAIEMMSYPGALAQVLTNLLTNAYTHAFEGAENGTVQVSVSRKDASTVRVVFADDGRGIAPKHRPKIFDPFFTTGRARGSTGLGLHIVYNLVTVTLGGSIDTWSEPGKGTRFTIDVPTGHAAKSPLPATEKA